MLFAMPIEEGHSFLLQHSFWEREKSMKTATMSRTSDLSYRAGDGPSQQQSSQNEESRTDHTEGMLARMIEEQTAKLPSDLFLWAALGSIGCSLFLQAC